MAFLFFRPNSGRDLRLRSWLREIRQVNTRTPRMLPRAFVCLRTSLSRSAIQVNHIWLGVNTLAVARPASQCDREHGEATKVARPVLLVQTQSKYLRHHSRRNSCGQRRAARIFRVPAHVLPRPSECDEPCVRLTRSRPERHLLHHVTQKHAFLLKIWRARRESRTPDLLVRSKP